MDLFETRCALLGRCWTLTLTHALADAEWNSPRAADGAGPCLRLRDGSESGGVTNGEVVELDAFRKEASATWREFTEWLRTLYGHEWNEGASHLSTGAFSRSVARLNDEVRKLKKNKKKDPEIEQFLSCHFQCPGSGTCPLSEESQQRPEKAPSSKTEVELSKCMGELQKQLSESRIQNFCLRRGWKKVKNKIRNMGKRLKRAKENVDLLSPKKTPWMSPFDDLECHVHLLEKKVASLEEKKCKSYQASAHHKYLIVIPPPEI